MKEESERFISRRRMSSSGHLEEMRRCEHDHMQELLLAWSIKDMKKNLRSCGTFGLPCMTFDRRICQPSRANGYNHVTETNLEQKFFV
jgi:hypothetical protein